MSTAKKQAPRFHVGDWVAFDFGSGRLEAKIVEDRGPIGARGRRLYRVESREDEDNSTTFEVQETNLQAVSIPIRHRFHISYMRKDPPNEWRATTKYAGVLKGVKEKGAIAYSTAVWANDPADDQRHATVTVLMEIDPRFGDPNHGPPPIKSRTWQGKCKNWRTRCSSPDIPAPGSSMETHLNIKLSTQDHAIRLSYVH